MLHVNMWHVHCMCISLFWVQPHLSGRSTLILLAGIMKKRPCGDGPALHGGRLQRAKLRAAQGAQSSKGPAPGRAQQAYDSCLAEHLLRQWAWGDISATALQELAMKAYQDEVNLLRAHGIHEAQVHSSLKSLASLGTWGKHSGNVHSQLLAWLGEPPTPAPMKHQVPLLAQKVKGGGEVEIHGPLAIFLPHELFAWYYKNDRARFQHLFLGSQESQADLKQFWKEVGRRKDPRLQQHDMCNRNRWSEHAIPLALHGDGVPVLQVGKAGSKGWDAFSFQSLFAFGKTLEVKLLIFGVFTASATEGTWLEAFRVVTWSLHWLYMGTWPEVDCYGNAWPEGSLDAKKGWPALS